MKNRDLKEKAAGLLKNELTPEEEKEVIRALEEEGISREEIEALRDLNSGLDSVFDREPDEKMDSRFYSMLQNESMGAKDSQKVSRFSFAHNNSWILVAAGISLFILGWFSASWFAGSRSGNEQITRLSGEISELKETLVLTMMEQTSTAERIKAVNMISEFETADSRIIGNLLRVLNTDNNDNVRLLALEALIKYTGDVEVRRELVSSIPKQSSPMIQLRMAEVMIALKEKSAADEFRKLLDDSNLNYNVRGKLQEALGILL